LIPPYVEGLPAVTTGGTGYSAPGPVGTGGKPGTGGSTGEAGGEHPGKTRVKMSTGADSTSTPTDQNKTESPKAKRRGGKP